MTTPLVPSTTDDLLIDLELMLSQRNHHRALKIANPKVSELLARRALIDRAIHAALQEQPT
ncbi:hypothetical protein [Pseudomonas marincola]|uniref:hypothetical protein n=1 Tax=Pseudomonas marincola TaxID=437900 RepID=UPI0012412C46|nr:hypothetical protein [Pseudomonas marincola]